MLGFSMAADGEKAGQVLEIVSTVPISKLSHTSVHRYEWSLAKHERGSENVGS